MDDIELPPETIAEVEDALSHGLVNDHEIFHVVVGLHAMMHVVGMKEVHASWIPAARLIEQIPDATVEQQADQFRDWIKGATAAMKLWLKQHNVPYIQHLEHHPCGCIRYYVVGEMPDDEDWGDEE